MYGVVSTSCVILYVHTYMYIYIYAQFIYFVINFYSGYDDSNFSLNVSMETVDDCCAFLWNDSGTTTTCLHQ